jgi:hypothetical protein
LETYGIWPLTTRVIAGRGAGFGSSILRQIDWYSCLNSKWHLPDAVLPCRGSFLHGHGKTKTALSWLTEDYVVNHIPFPFIRSQRATARSLSDHPNSRNANTTLLWSECLIVDRSWATPLGHPQNSSCCGTILPGVLEGDLGYQQWLMLAWKGVAQVGAPLLPLMGGVDTPL